MEDLIAGCCQFRVVPGNVDENVKRVEAAIGHFGEKGCRLLVFPEMWSCGFAYPTLKSMADRTPGVLEKLREWARRWGMVLVGSLPERQGDEVFNTSFVIDVTGEVAGKYRKIHLFTLHDEHSHFGRGISSLVCRTAVGHLGIGICYDLRFPELARRLALDGAEILCISALWPVGRIEHWSVLLRARAIENQLFVIGCNGCGIEGPLQYGGASAIVSPTGQVLDGAEMEEKNLVGSLDLEELRVFRRHIPCFSDRFPSAYAPGSRISE